MAKRRTTTAEAKAPVKVNWVGHLEAAERQVAKRLQEGIRDWMLEHGLTWEAVAGTAGCSTNGARHWGDERERGHHTPTVAQLYRLEQLAPGLVARVFPEELEA